MYFCGVSSSVITTGLLYCTTSYIALCNRRLGALSVTNDITMSQSFESRRGVHMEVFLDVVLQYQTNIVSRFPARLPGVSPSKAHGEVVCSVLTFLTDKALEALGHVWRPPVYAEEETMEEAELEEDCDVGDIADETDVAEEEEEGVLEQDFVEINAKASR